MSKKSIQLTLALVALAAAGSWAFFNVRGPAQKFDLTPYNALGTGVAEETARLTNRKGRVIIVAPDTSKFKDPVTDGQLAAFERSIKESGLSIAATIRFDLTAMERMGSGGAVPSSVLSKAILEHSDAAAVVLFCPFPQDYLPSKAGDPKFVVASGYLPFYRKLLESRVIAAAIVPKTDRSAPGGKKPRTLQEWFKEEYVILTPENISISPN